MKAASAMASGLHPSPDLAEQAVRTAMESAGISSAGTVMLFLSREFARHAQPAILAAARAAGSLQVFGMTASGLFTEQGWLLDQAGAAALVIENSGSTTTQAPLLSFSSQNNLPFDWQDGQPRAGLLDADAAVWAHGRQPEGNRTETMLAGFEARLALSTGLRLLGDIHSVGAIHGYDLQRIGDHRAVDSLRRCLPAELREQPPLHQIVALRQPDQPGIAVLSANHDGSLTLGESLAVGDRIRWAMRQPLAAEQDMRQSLTTAAADPDGQHIAPDFALMFSCIGRGPLFYGSEDRDLLAFRQQFPNTPLLGAYGSGQIAPAGSKNRLFHNAVVTLLFESAHV